MTRMKIAHALAFVVTLVLAVTSFADIPISTGFEALKVKSVSRGPLDPESRRNLALLKRDNALSGPTPVWVIINMEFQADLVPESDEFNQQRQHVWDEWSSIASDIHISDERVDTADSGPYVTFDASARELVALSKHPQLLGFYGLIGAAKMSDQ